MRSIALVGSAVILYILSALTPLAAQTVNGVEHAGNKLYVWEKYVGYAQMHVNSPDIAKRRPNIEAFRKNPYINIPEAGWRPRFFSMTPASASDPAVVDAFAKAAAQIEAKTPTGPQLDMVTIMPMINPRLIPVPTMLIHGEYDDVADLDGLLPFFQQLPNRYKRYVVIPNAGHMMHLQEGHRLFQHEVASFFKAP